MASLRPLPRLILLVAALAPCACTPQSEVAEEMQRAIRGTEQALDATLLATELFWWAEAPPTVTLRHGEACGCPCRERIGGDDLLLLDYALDGCRPDSTLIPDELLGHVTLRDRGSYYEALPDNLEREPATTARGGGRSDVRTDLIGEWTTSLQLQGTIQWDVQWADIDLTVRPFPAGITVTGAVRGPTAWVDFYDFRLAFADVQGRCPRGSDGTAHVWARDAPIQLDADDDGTLTATWKDASSLPTDPCDLVGP